MLHNAAFFVTHSPNSSKVFQSDFHFFDNEYLILIGFTFVISLSMYHSSWSSVNLSDKTLELIQDNFFLIQEKVVSPSAIVFNTRSIHLFERKLNNQITGHLFAILNLLKNKLGCIM